MKQLLNGLYENTLLLSLKARFAKKELTEKEIWTNPSFQRIVVKYIGEGKIIFIIILFRIQG
jgi:hypothetical protein